MSEASPHIRVRLGVFLKDAPSHVKPLPTLQDLKEEDFKDLDFKEIKRLCEYPSSQGGFGKKVRKLFLIYT